MPFKIAITSIQHLSKSGEESSWTSVALFIVFQSTVKGHRQIDLMSVQHTYKTIIDQLGECNVPLLNANISTSIPAGGSILNLSNDDFDVRCIRRNHSNTKSCSEF